MSYNYQDAPRESQQEYFGKVHTDNKETLQNALKRIEELEAQIEKMKCCGNCKNEWHKVLDGDFPKHSNEVLCLLWGGTKEIGCYKNELWYFEDFTADKDDVDYWQEIISPKENE